MRVKVQSEKVLFGLASNTKLRVIAYRPDYIGPTDEEAHIGQILLYWFFSPVGAAAMSFPTATSSAPGVLFVTVTRMNNNGAQVHSPGCRYRSNKRKTAYKSLKGARVNLIFYPGLLRISFR